jgi:hypothetical protein
MTRRQRTIRTSGRNAATANQNRTSWRTGASLRPASGPLRAVPVMSQLEPLC